MVQLVLSLSCCLYLFLKTIFLINLEYWSLRVLYLFFIDLMTSSMIDYLRNNSLCFLLSFTSFLRYMFSCFSLSNSWCFLLRTVFRLMIALSVLCLNERKSASREAKFVLTANNGLSFGGSSSSFGFRLDTCSVKFCKPLEKLF